MPDMSDNSEVKYFTVKQLAKRWDVSERHIQRLITADAFPNAIRVGMGRSHFRVPVADVLAYEEAQKQINRS